MYHTLWLGDEYSGSMIVQSAKIDEVYRGNKKAGHPRLLCCNRSLHLRHSQCKKVNRHVERAQPDHTVLFERHGDPLPHRDAVILRAVGAAEFH